jgi:hypothetical protein
MSQYGKKSALLIQFAWRRRERAWPRLRMQLGASAYNGRNCGNESAASVSAACGCRSIHAVKRAMRSRTCKAPLGAGCAVRSRN